MRPTGCGMISGSRNRFGATPASQWAANWRPSRWRSSRPRIPGISGLRRAAISMGWSQSQGRRTASRAHGMGASPRHDAGRKSARGQGRGIAPPVTVPGYLGPAGRIHADPYRRLPSAPRPSEAGRSTSASSRHGRARPGGNCCCRKPRGKLTDAHIAELAPPQLRGDRHVSAFESGEPALDNWPRRRARANQISGAEVIGVHGFLLHALSPAAKLLRKRRLSRIAGKSDDPCALVAGRCCHASRRSGLALLLYAGNLRRQGTGSPRSHWGRRTYSGCWAMAAIRVKTSLH